MSLSFGDLAFGRAIRPWKDNGVANGVDILFNAIRE